MQQDSEIRIGSGVLKAFFKDKATMSALRDELKDRHEQQRKDLGREQGASAREAAAEIWKDGRVRLDALQERHEQERADLIREKPDQVLTVLTNDKSVFETPDIARALHRYLDSDGQAFQNALASVLASPSLVELRPDSKDGRARYSTREMVELEAGITDAAARLHQAKTHGVDSKHVQGAIQHQDAAIRSTFKSADASGLTEEQRAAVVHLTGPEQIAAVVGYAGAGKSTLLKAAREAWEAQGFKVHGATLSGKAAEGLEQSSGIASRTLAAWDIGLKDGHNQLGRGDVFVIDEAGMVGSRQLSRFVQEAEARGAKLVLVGDHEQLQAIGAGAPFRSICEQIGHVSLSEIRRQRDDWQRGASAMFATHRTAEGLAAYQARGDIQLAPTLETTRSALVKDFLADRDARPDGSRVALAHRRADVHALNDEIRAALKERGELSNGVGVQTNDGAREFARGDRIVFLENNKKLGVKNGMLGTVQDIEDGQIVTRLDGEKGRSVTVPTKDYKAIDHGYSTTIHKSQGATVDRSFVMASATMDRHLTYVAMTRHKDGARLYANRQEFSADRMREDAAFKMLSARLQRQRIKESTSVYTRNEDAARRTEQKAADEKSRAASTPDFAKASLPENLRPAAPTTKAGRDALRRQQREDRARGERGSGGRDRER